MFLVYAIAIKIAMTCDNTKEIAIINCILPPFTIDGVSDEFPGRYLIGIIVFQIKFFSMRLAMHIAICIQTTSGFLWIIIIATAIQFIHFNLPCQFLFFPVNPAFGVQNQNGTRLLQYGDFSVNK